jgi:acyl-CoA dehydrogenase
MRREDTPGEARFRAEVRSWLESNAERRTGEGDWSMGPRNHTPEAEAAYFDRCREWQRRLYDGGWAAITWPEAVGGRGGTPAEALIFAEEQAGFDATSGYLAASISLIGPALIHFGTQEQKARYLPPMLRGEEVWCQLFSEPAAGSDLAALRCRAVREGDDFVVNGQKVWTTSAQYADHGFLLARTNVDAPKHRGISFLLVDMKDPGIEVRPLVTMKGDRHFNEVFFSDVRVPVANVVGEIDEGWSVAKLTLMNESAMIGTSSAHATSVESLVGEAIRRERMDEPLVRQRLAQACVEDRVLGFLQDRLQNAILDGRRPDVDGSVLKILWAETRYRKAETAVWLQGGDGLLLGSDAPAEGFWQDQILDRPMGSVGGGTLEVHRNGLGERALGLPKEPRDDRDQPFRDLKSSEG